MKKTLRQLPILLAMALYWPTSLSAADRLMTIGGGVSEVVCALGACDKIIAVDSSSTYPAQLQKLPQVGYSRALNVEGIVAQKPSLIILGDESGPADVLKKLEALKIPLVKVTENHSLKSSFERIRAIGDALGKKAEAEAMVKDLDEKIQTLSKAFSGKKPKVLFVYARGAKVMQVAGQDTSVDSMITLAGGENAIQSVKGYKPFTAEAIVAANPDIILMTEKGAESLGGASKIFDLPGMKLTSAFAKKRLVTEEDLRLLTIGPRTPDVLKNLNSQFTSGGH
jgi:iron complex transport system substrate-binding protein